MCTISWAQDYTAENKAIDCKCRTAEVLRFTGTDWAQDQASQDAAWATFAGAYGLDVANDYVDKRTKTYNCHSYAFNGKDRWLNGGAEAREKFFGDTKGCWAVDGTGTVKSSSTHSMLVADNQGKCGDKFLCKNNQKVYSPAPSTVYKYVAN